MSFTILKRGQIKMFESIAILMVFMFLVAIGIKFYGTIETSKLEETAQRFSAIDSVKLSIVLSNLPELACSSQNIERSSCIDLYKAQSFDTLISQDNNPIITAYYFDLLGFSTITLEQIEPYREPLMIHDRKPPGDYSTILTPLPVTIFNPTTHSYSLGVLKVQVYVT